MDLVVVGAGAGGMVAALVAALEGLRVVLCEGSQQVGGTTATSAGTLWIPGNRHGAEAGHADSVQAAASYLDALIGPDSLAQFVTHPPAKKERPMFIIGQGALGSWRRKFPRVLDRTGVRR
ncbi:MAG: FAD-dependent oxidoreductase [Actinobacteria bacterium]|nr:FAD-dependent oxidoreductase [Actinomycetota bacterium]